LSSAVYAIAMAQSSGFFWAFCIEIDFDLAIDILMVFITARLRKNRKLNATAIGSCYLGLMNLLLLSQWSPNGNILCLH